MCRGGWYTFSFRYAQALTKGPSHSVLVTLFGCQCVPLSPRVHVLCWLCSEATFFAHGTANPSMSPKVCVQICSNWGVDYPGPGISVGDRPGRMAKCMWGPSSFNSRPGWSGLCFSSALGRGIKGLKGLEGTAIQRHRPPDGRCAPVRLRYGHTVWTVYSKRASQTDGWMVKLTDPATENQQATN